VGGALRLADVAPVFGAPRIGRRRRQWSGDGKLTQKSGENGGKMVGKLRFFHQGNGKIENFEAGEMERLPANCDLVNHKTANQKGQKKLPIVVSQPNHSGFLESLHFCCAVSNRFSGATPNPCLKELEKS
jgi:hypothetical protein